MGRVDNYLTGTTRINAFLDTDWAADIGRHIAAKSVSITITRRGTALAAQTVRIEVLGGSSFTNERRGDVAEVGKTQVAVFGYYNHPTATDTDIERGDTFKLGDQKFEVIAVYPDERYRVIAIANAEA